MVAPDTNGDNLDPVAKPEESSGMSAFTYIIIGAGILVFIVLVIVTVLALKRGLGRKGENAQ